MSGFGAVVSIELRDAATADAMCAAVQVISHATSIGGVESTIERRAKLPGQEHVPAGLLRLSVGCEHLEDLWADLAAALGAAPDTTARWEPTSGAARDRCRPPVRTTRQRTDVGSPPAWPRPPRPMSPPARDRDCGLVPSGGRIRP